METHNQWYFIKIENFFNSGLRLGWIIHESIGQVIINDEIINRINTVSIDWNHVNYEEFIQDNIKNKQWFYIVGEMFKHA